MSKINILTKEIYNRISAGEVIERPSSAVKELVENSLDAGATDIEVYIEKGGKQLIKVIDNGSGIEKDDLHSAFIPHATSKISSVDDLEKITTLGFRGEALASISSISKTEIVSVTEGNEACRIECNEGVVGSIQPAALEKGTEITVYQLFFNTPARYKFLKSDKLEEGDIDKMVAKFILGNPTVSFRYYVEGKLKLQSFGGGLDEAMAQVFGANVLPQFFKIDAAKHDINIRGFLGNQNYFRSNKSFQFIFLNGRFIQNEIISTAIMGAYSSYLMKRQYPCYVLYIDVPADSIDVNVHPTKSDVRFIDNKWIYGTVYSIISSILDGSAKAADFVVDSMVVPVIQSTSGMQSSSNVVYHQNQVENQTIKANNSLEREEKRAGSYQNDTLKTQAPQKREQPALWQMKNESDEEVGQPSFVNQEKKGQSIKLDMNAPLSVAYNIKKDSKQHNDLVVKCSERENESVMPSENSKTLSEEKKVTEQSFREETENSANVPNTVKEKNIQQAFLAQESVYCGTLFHTYLIYECGNSAYLIDQHAAHERLLFDSFMEKINNRTVARQGMLVPYVFNVNAEESSFLEQKLGVLQEIGFDIEPFGVNSFRVSEIPVDLQNIQIDEFFKEILSDLDDLKAINLQDMLREKIATTACKHAIKGGWDLTKEEKDKLFERMEGNMGLKCPHGRPVCVKLTKTEIEKMFKRIV